ncbi:hypothetical protein [uncultured Bacteroides sp.]|uniref:hypothetical protein n=1 Tax=uncultured Bacteroides sp. TaxID=162156 RepID=UPI00280B6213|nr:hypothetical protein [uncultured Bacteroides sp.]
MHLCADDVLTRKKLAAYHDGYARVMGNTVCNEAYVARKHGIPPLLSITEI